MAFSATRGIVAGSISSVFHSPHLRDICSLLGCKSELDRLQITVVTARAILLAEEDMNYEAKLLIQDLKDTIDNADDLLDEFVTLAECINKKPFKKGAFYVIHDESRYFFSVIKNLPAAFKMSQEIKRIRHDLDAIVNETNFKRKEETYSSVHSLDNEKIFKRKVETCSDVYSLDIIGREDDREKIVNMLLEPNATQNVSFLSIVGMGGLGKTTLAQLVFNDERIQREFYLMLWVYVGDEDSNHLNVKMVLSKILSCFDRLNDENTLDFLQRKVGELLANKKYFLVLDNMCNENHLDWHGLEVLLKRGAPGSCVVVTTRSHRTAAIVKDGLTYDLKGLSEKDSWRLFEMVAFSNDVGQGHPQDLVRMGKRIIEKCHNVPLSIRVVGSLLFGQGKEKWLAVEENKLATSDSILSVLNLSYQHLDSPLKRCFRYCALFPKDFEIDIEMLIGLWMAQGYVVPTVNAQSMEDAALEYFAVLFRRCFLQDVKKNESGDIVSVTMHNLLHDLAQIVANNEVCTVDNFKSDLDKKIRHLSVAKGISTDEEESWTKHNIRTLLLLYGQMEGLSLQILLKNCKSLRALDLRGSGMDIFPDEICRMLHLRYLDLSSNNFMLLPKSFTKLHNLETLNLSGCTSLKKLPDDIWKLVKLRYLDIQGCKSMTHMPASLGKLSCLRTLTMFVVDLSHPDCSDLLEGVKSLENIKGRFEIRIHRSENASLKKENNWEGKCLTNKKYVKEIVISFPRKGAENECQEKLMEVMQPNENLKRLELKWYNGESLGSWGRDNLAWSLPNLVEIQLYHCEDVRYLPCMAQLSCLKRLIIDSLPNLEYVEENRNRNAGRVGPTSEISEIAEESCFFPRLEVLVLQRLKKLKGWWREEDSPLPFQVQHFPALLKLKVGRCPELTFLPSIPNAKEVELIEVSDMLRVAVDTNELRGGGPSLKMEVDNFRYLKGAMPLQRLTTLVVEFDDKVETLQEVEEVLLSCRSSLQDLKILSCSNLRSVGRGVLEYLWALRSLQISNCSGLTFTEEGGNNEAGLSSSSSFPFPQSLRSLDLSFLRKMEKLPEGMRNLTSLESLSISNCKALVSLPEWIQQLTSRSRLEIRQCSVELQRRCSPNEV